MGDLLIRKFLVSEILHLSNQGFFDKTDLSFTQKRPLRA